MTLGYVARRVGVFFLVVFFAVSINFLIPRLRPTNPIAARMYEFAASGAGRAGDFRELIAIYNEKFGLDKPLWQQYITYWGDVLRFDLGTSISFYPGLVRDEIMRAAPWTIGLLAVSTLLAFTIGSLLGALLAWPRTGRVFSIFVPLLMTLSAIPYYLLGLVLVYLFALVWPVLPSSSAYTSGARLTLSWPMVVDILRHAILPAASIILAGIGFWGLGMRAMMITTMGEDYMIMAQAKGLRGRTIFFDYALRNALLPQVTGLAISLAGIMSGAILVEIVFGYPGIGFLLYRAISSNDYFVIQGVVFFVILSVGLALLILDLVYPLLDPRIQFRRS
ncbi:MAG: ABC transporter permease [Chloroflexi bacterium]|nr:MAG: ABC transporter permease [Chloroflexota bacterium]